MKLGKAKLHYALTGAKLFIRNNLTCIVVGLLCALAGVIIGIVVARSFGEDYTKLNFIIAVNVGEYAYFKTLIIYLALTTAAYALLIACGLNRYLNLIAFAAIVYIGYRWGIGMVGTFNQGAIAGVISITLFYIPIFLTLALGMIISLCIIAFARCGSKGIFSSQHLFRSTLTRILPIYLINICVIFVCTVLIPICYRIIFT
ncbi:MAG: hypothetical protein K2I79_03270 [Clostridia bacterium]|nr:hypothetical protein [Clostridia bacterium]